MSRAGASASSRPPHEPPVNNWRTQQVEALPTDTLLCGN